MFQNSKLNELATKYREQKLAHAYLLETNNIPLAIEDLKELIKLLDCPNTFTTSCTKCNLCNLINKNNLPNLKIIEPEGTTIKKSQIEELKSDFNAIPLYSKYNIYIIKNAEKLNPSSVNSMLKFVEEPDDGIIGFFLTNNKDIMLDTIKSRCQTVVLDYEIKTLTENLELTSEEFNKYSTIIKTYLTQINTENTINNKKLILTNFSERKDIENLFKIIFEIYYNHYLRSINRDYNKDITNLFEINENIPKINQKLQIITNILTDLSYNVSMELILDRFVIEMRGAKG